MSTSVPYRTPHPDKLTHLEPPKHLHLKRQWTSVPCWQLSRHCRGTGLADMCRMTTVTRVTSLDIGRMSAPGTRGTTMEGAEHADGDTGEEDEAEAGEEVEVSMP